MWKNIKRVLKVLLIVLGIILILLCLYLIGVRIYRGHTSANNEISEIRTYNLGGIDQEVLLDGKSTDNPLLIYFHGGPGSTYPMNTGSRGFYKDVTRDYTLVLWDQLGSGINLNDAAMDTEITDYVDMSIDLIKEINEDFPNNEIILLGISWGSYLTAEATLEVPELIDEVIVYGQILSDLFINDEVFSELLNNDKVTEEDKAALRLTEQKESYSIEDMNLVVDLIFSHTDGYITGIPPVGDMIVDFITSMDYTWGDRMAVLSNDISGNDAFVEPLLSLDLHDTLENIQVPYRIVQGEKDLVTSTSKMIMFMEETENPNLSLEVVENSSHFPSKEALDMIMRP